MRNGEQIEVPCQLVSPFRAPETLGGLVVDVKHKKPVRQGIIVHGVPGGAPLTKENQFAAQSIKQFSFATGKPGAQLFELSLVGFPQVLTSVLCPDDSVRTDGKSHVGAIELFLNHDVVCLKLGRFVRR